MKKSEGCTTVFSTVLRDRSRSPTTHVHTEEVHARITASRDALAKVASADGGILDQYIEAHVRTGEQHSAVVCVAYTGDAAVPSLKEGVNCHFFGHDDTAYMLAHGKPHTACDDSAVLAMYRRIVEVLLKAEADRPRKNRREVRPALTTVVLVMGSPVCGASVSFYGTHRAVSDAIADASKTPQLMLKALFPKRYAELKAVESVNWSYVLNDALSHADPPIKPVDLVTELRLMVRQCMWCRKAGFDYPFCGGCHGVSYCGAECQRAHWKEGRHKSTCVSTPKHKATKK